MRVRVKFWCLRYNGKEAIDALWRDILPVEKSFSGVDALTVAVVLHSEGFDSMRELEDVRVDRLKLESSPLKAAVGIVVQKATEDARRRASRKVRAVSFLCLQIAPVVFAGGEEGARCGGVECCLNQSGG